MNIAGVSLGSLVLAILLGGFSRVNVGVLALGFAWVIGVLLARIPTSTVLAGFPLTLAAVLFGITMLSAQWLTLGAITMLILCGAANHEEAIKAVPWDTLIMVCGISTLIAILASTGGLDLFYCPIASGQRFAVSVRCNLLTSGDDSTTIAALYSCPLFSERSDSPLPSVL